MDNLPHRPLTPPLTHTATYFVMPSIVRMRVEELRYGHGFVNLMLLIRCYVILLLQNQFYIGPDTTGNGSKVVMAVQSDGKGDRFLWQKISL